MTEANILRKELKSAFRGRISAYQLINNGYLSVDSFFEDAFAIFETQQQLLLSEQNFLKTYGVFVVDLVKHSANAENDGGEIHQRFDIHCDNQVISSIDTDLYVLSENSS